MLIYLCELICFTYSTLQGVGAYEKVSQLV